MKPSERQRAVLFLAESEGYVRPASPTHARRCNTSVGNLSKTAAVCHRQGWLRPISDGRYVITDAGREHVPGTPIPAPDEAIF